MSNEGAGANDEAARILAVQENARRLGLTWQRTIGTVSTVDPVTVTLDGDTEAIGVVSMIGPVTLGQRVYVDAVPPSGNFISGSASPTGELTSGNLNSVSAVFSTVSPNFVSMTLVTPSLAFTKKFAATRLVLDMHATGYVSAGAGQTVDIGLLVNGDYVVGSLVYNNINQHLQISGVLYVPAGVAPGDYTIIPRVRISGGSTFNQDSGDRVSFEVIEKM